MQNRLTLAHYIKNLKLIERNREWLSANEISALEKILFYPQILASIVGPGKKIKYLGNTMHYDNPATPLNLQDYPYEITKKILANMDERPKQILDIGANIGQFSLTMRRVLGPDARIDAFEPNPFVFNILEKNVVNLKDSIKIHNYGVGDRDEVKKIYFNESRTGIGSLIKENAGVGADSSSEITITSHVEKVTKRKRYDLIKIDVEGYEFQALKGLTGIKTEYLFLELSGLGRKKEYVHSDALKLLEKLWGKYDICYIGGYQKKDSTFDILVHFIN